MHRARLVAFYLPQYHPIPENDLWWGENFTEWVNVRKGVPFYPGHEQPIIPGELSYYDLSDPDIRERQVGLAKSYGISAFCYWHYWFNGKRLLERPFNEVLATGKPDFPFCLGWANEPWGRHWDGEPHKILQDQRYGGERDAREHIKWLIPTLADKRAFKIEGRPVFLIYRPLHIPKCKQMIDLWRREVKSAGLHDLFLIAIETSRNPLWDPRPFGFDAAVQFQPQTHHIRYNVENNSMGRIKETIKACDNKLTSGMIRRFLFNNRVGRKFWMSMNRETTLFAQMPGRADYAKNWPKMLAAEEDIPYRRYPGVCPRWDNTPRRGINGFVLENSSPEEYGCWLDSALNLVEDEPEEHRIVFINAWNEWGEGNYLEPDAKFGRAYLEATAKTVFTDK